MSPTLLEVIKNAWCDMNQSPLDVVVKYANAELIADVIIDEGPDHTVHLAVYIWDETADYVAVEYKAPMWYGVDWDDFGPPLVYGVRPVADVRWVPSL